MGELWQINTKFELFELANVVKNETLCVIFKYITLILTSNSKRVIFFFSSRTKMTPLSMLKIRKHMWFVMLRVTQENWFVNVFFRV